MLYTGPGGVVRQPASRTVQRAVFGRHVCMDSEHAVRTLFDAVHGLVLFVDIECRVALQDTGPLAIVCIVTGAAAPKKNALS